MRNNFLKSFIIAIATLGMFTIQSCDTDPCADVDCGINGTCFEGICDCDAGYDGTDCNIVIRSLFTGVYDVKKFCDTDPTFEDKYTSTISESFDGIQYITISNIYNFSSFTNVQPEDATVLASVSNSGGEYTLLIENQTFTSDILSDFEVAGFGTYDPGTSIITINYSITDTSLPPTDEDYIDNCAQTFELQ